MLSSQPKQPILQPYIIRFTPEELLLLLRRALRRNATGRIVWVNGDSEAVIDPDNLKLSFKPGLVLIQCEFETDQTGRASMVLVYRVADRLANASLTAITEETPRGNALLAARWGEIAQEVFWNALLQIAADRFSESNENDLILNSLYTDGQQLAFLAGPRLSAADITTYYDALREASDGDIPTTIEPDPVEFEPEEAPPRMRRLILVFADDGKPVPGYDDLQDGTVINLNQLPNTRLSILAETTPAAVGSVVFQLNQTDQQRIENLAPYTLFGDEDGAIVPWQPDPTDYTIRATPYPKAGGAGIAGPTLQVRLRFVADEPLAIDHFTLVNAATNKTLIDPLPADATINLADLPTRKLNVVAHTNPQEVGSVVFGLNNNAAYRVENFAPYSLRGDTNGNYHAWTPQGDDYLISATPYSGENGTGTVGPTRTIRLRFIDKTQIAITSFTLIDADQDAPINAFDPIPSGTTIDLGLLPTRNLNIRANTHPEQVGSVVFERNGRRERIENVPPYALFGDRDADFADGQFEVDTYTIRATPYTKEDGKGEAGDALTIRFSVIDKPPELAVVSFSLIDPATSEAVPGYDPIPEGAVISRRKYRQKRFDVRANINGDSADSVIFTLNGDPLKPVKGPPFLLFGGQGRPMDNMLLRLRAEPVSQSGETGVEDKVRFRVTD